MRSHPKSVQAPTWIGLLLLLLVAVAYTWAQWRFFTTAVPGGNDFLANTSAWEAYLRHDINPYSDDAALFTQNLIYGRPAQPGEDQNRLVYPFYSILLHGPFVFIEYPLARAIYMTLLQLALGAGVILTLQVLAWRPPTWLAGLLLAWSILSYPQARGIILGQFAIFGFFSIAATLYLLERGRDGWAGAILVLSTMKPTLVFLVVPFLLLWGLARRRWRFLAGFGIAFGLCLAFSFLALPTWLFDWLLRVDRYTGYTVGQSPVWLLAHQALPWLGRAGEWALSLALLALMGWTWWAALRRPGRAAFAWALSVTLLVSSLIVPRSATTNYVMLLLPTLWLFAALDRNVTGGRLAIVGLMLVSLVGMWWLHFATVVGNQEQAIMFVPYPLALGLALLLSRSLLWQDARQMGAEAQRV